MRLYAPEHPERPFRHAVFDDTLDAHPPYHLYEGKATPEELAAAAAKAAELGLVRARSDGAMRRTHGSRGGIPSARSTNGVLKPS
jgi:hypothetical protein